MHFIIVGLNHKTADIDTRSRIHFTKDKIIEALNILKECPSVKGSVIISTCNRVEIYASVDNIENGYDEIIDFISKYHKIDKNDLLPVIYKKNCQDAVAHLFKVAASLDSMLIGEYQIQGQIREAYCIARENNSTNNMLNKLFQTAIQIGKKTRTETAIGNGSVSLASVAVELVQQIFKQKQHLKVLIIGAGKISTLTLKNLNQNKACGITIINRSKEKAVELAEEFGGIDMDFENRYEAVVNNDIIIASTGSQEHIIKQQELSTMIKFADNKKRVFIDLSVPRNIDPLIKNIENIDLYCIDDLNKLIISNLDKRTEEVTKVEKIIEDISEDYYEWYAKQSIIPLMHEIKKELDVLKERTICSYKAKFNTLDSLQQEMIHEMLNSYSDKLIKVIMKNFKTITSKEDLFKIAHSLKHSFTLDLED